MVLSFTLYGCREVSNADEFKQIMSKNEYIIIDVRTNEEYDESHLIDAINIPSDEIDQNTALDKDKIIFVYCKSGNRSSIAFET